MYKIINNENEEWVWSFQETQASHKCKTKPMTTIKGLLNWELAVGQMVLEQVLIMKTFIDIYKWPLVLENKKLK